MPVNATDPLPFDALPVVRGVVVEVEELAALAHRCDPRLCAGGASCCAAYDVCVDDAEAAAILGFIAEAARFAPGLRGGAGGMFVELRPGLTALRRDEGGLCALACRDGVEVRCSLHSAAAAAGMPVEEVKPLSCRLWPLTLTSSRPRYLSVDPDAFSFPCARRREGRGGRLDAGVADTIRATLGEGFLAELEAVLRARAPDS